MPNIGLDIKKDIYHSLFESHLNYGITIWASSFSKDALNNFDYAGVPDNLKNVKKAQNKIIRSIFCQPRFNKTTQLYIFYVHAKNVMNYSVLKRRVFSEIRLTSIVTPKKVCTSLLIHF